MPQPSGNGAQFAGDDRTQLLAPVGKDDTIRYVVGHSGVKGRYRYRQAPWQAGFEQDAANIRSDFDKALTAVIPVTPAKPEPPKANNDDPWKECMVAVIAGAILAAVVFAAGVVVGGMWF